MRPSRCSLSRLRIARSISSRPWAAASLCLLGTLLPPPLPRMPRRHAAAQLRHPRPPLRRALVIPKVEHRRALLRPLGPIVIGAQQTVPEEAGDAIIAVLVVEMMR